MKINLKQNRGITLVVLIITIIILLLLAGVTISQLTNNNLITKAQVSSQKAEYASAKEILDIKLLDIKADSITKNTQYNINKIEEDINNLKSEFTIEMYYNGDGKEINGGTIRNTENLKAIVVSVNQYSKYKFLIGEDEKNNIKILGVLDKLTNKTLMSDFKSLDKFEEGEQKDNENKDEQEENNKKLISYIDFEGNSRSERIKNDLNDTDFTKTISSVKIKTDKVKNGQGSCYFPGVAGGNIRQDISELNLGTKDFTVEFWANPEEQLMPYALFFGSYSNANLNLFIRDGEVNGNMSLAIGTTRIINTNKKYTPNEWTHYAVVRKDGIFTLYENGENIGQTDQYKNSNISMTDLSISGNISISNTSYKGYMDDFAICDYAKYTSNFDSEKSNISSANIVYASFEEYGIPIADKITKNPIIFSNDSKTYVTNSKCKSGVKSCYFSGATGGEIRQEIEKLNFETKDFTVEFWANPEVQTSPYALFFGSYSNTNLNLFVQDAAANSNLSLVIGNTRIINTNKKYTSNEWIHYAVVRKDRVFTVYENGNNIGQTDKYKDLPISITDLSIGGNISQGDTAYKGYIDEFAIYDYAKYTNNFNPSNKSIM